MILMLAVLLHMLRRRPGPDEEAQRRQASPTPLKSIALSRHSHSSLWTPQPKAIGHSVVLKAYLFNESFGKQQPDACARGDAQHIPRIFPMLRACPLHTFQFKFSCLVN